MQNKRKAGRKSIPQDSEDKRIARNRRAQRLFRERKEAHLFNLETTVKLQSARIEELLRINSQLSQELQLTRGSKQLQSSQEVSPNVVITPPLENMSMANLESSLLALQSQTMFIPGSSPDMQQMQPQSFNYTDDLGLSCLSAPNTPYQLSSLNLFQQHSPLATGPDFWNIDSTYLNAFLMSQNISQNMHFEPIE
ncbi:hypothetical protein BDR26DRAFT_852339 [Obelidium mucronatum]|nr:hypothetical protein BDR26DRAFT_852339 [Obelidium mucronatum]